MKKFIAIIMSVLLLVLPVLSGCGEKSDSSDVAEPSNVTFEKNVVALAGNYEITMEEIEVYIDMLVPYIQQSTGTDEGWEDMLLNEGRTARDELINAAIEEARYQHAFLQDAREKGLYTQEEEASYIAEYLTSVGGEEVYNDLLEEYGFSDAALKKYIAYMGAYYEVTNEACSDEDAAKIYDEEYITAKHILILFEGRENEDAAYNEAKAIYDRAKNGENFENLIAECNEDPGQDAETGYTFTEGEMVDEFYEGALALKTGEISTPVKTTYGYHIIKRYNNPEKGSDLYNSYVANIKNAKANEYMTEEKYNEIIAAYPLVVNESILSQIDLSRYTVVTSLDENTNYGDGSVFNE